jgi:hypothetical protein
MIQFSYYFSFVRGLKPCFPTALQRAGLYSSKNVCLSSSAEFVSSFINSETRENVDLVGDGVDGNGSSFIWFFFLNLLIQDIQRQ